MPMVCVGSTVRKTVRKVQVEFCDANSTNNSRRLAFFPHWNVANLTPIGYHHRILSGNNVRQYCVHNSTCLNLLRLSLGDLSRYCSMSDIEGRDLLTRTLEPVLTAVFCDMEWPHAHTPAFDKQPVGIALPWRLFEYTVSRIKSRDNRDDGGE